MRNILVAALTIAALLGFLVFWDSAPTLFLRGMQTRPPALPTADSYMTTTVTRKFDEAGALAYTLTATKAESFTADDIVVLTEPRLLASPKQPEDAPWHLKAATGVLHNADRRIVMRTDVRVWQDADKGTSELKTAELTYLADTRHVQSDLPVELISPRAHSTAVGLSADLEPKVYKLLSRVHSVFQPK
ncbi:MAG: LPS export ABC transporter periplasmic protein LptC [Porticoccaceae bacterium]